jgi:uncharacterized protein involved in exopolysaccharide biosynthesis
VTASNPDSPPAAEPLLPVAWYALGRRLLRRSRERWWLVSAFGLVGALAAGGATLLLPRSYAASAVFQADAGTGPPTGGPLLTTMAGAQLAADLLTTVPVLQRVAAARFPWNGASVPLWRAYGLEREPEHLRLAAAARTLRGALSVNIDLRTAILTLTVEASTPELAKALADTVLAALNVAGIELRQAHLAPERARRAQRIAHANREVTGAEAALASFYERHRVLNAPALQLEEWRLRRRVETAQDVAAQLQLEEEEATVAEVTPTVGVIDPPELPAQPHRPKRRRAVLTGLLIGVALVLTRFALERPAAE